LWLNVHENIAWHEDTQNWMNSITQLSNDLNPFLCLDLIHMIQQYC
jgi:hypothetical protein